MNTIKKGDIYYADLNPATGSEQGGIRPVLIIQNDIGNMHSKTVIVAAITTKRNDRHFPMHVKITAQESGLARESVILLEQIRTIDKDRLKEKFGSLDPEKLEEVEAALRVSFDIKKEERSKIMNELIKVTYSNEVLERDIRKALLNAKSFEEFFNLVCDLKNSMHRDGLKQLSRIINEFYSLDIYSVDVISNIKDMIMCEMVLPCSNPKLIKHTELDYRNKIVNDFSNVFPKYKYISKEVSVEKVGRIDILAYDLESKRPVIIELKKNRLNPTRQLLAYSTQYNNPILIGISEDELPDKMKKDNIIYYTFNELGVSL